MINLSADEKRWVIENEDWKEQQALAFHYVSIEFSQSVYDKNNVFLAQK